MLAGNEYDGEEFNDWLSSLRVEAKELAIAALEKRAFKLGEAGNNQPAIELLRESLSLEPLKEETHRTIMRLYATIGERAMAMAQFRTCKELLRHELDTEPDPETRALADRIALRDEAVPSEVRQQISTAMVVETVQTARPEKVVSDTSIAILPFVNTSGDAEQADIIDGITEDILTDLAKVSALSVTAKSASQIYAGSNLSAAQVAAEIGVRYVLEGSMRKASNKVRISARLIDAPQNLQVWAERYDRELDDIFELQSEISGAITSALQVKLVKESKDTDISAHTTSAEAYQYFLKGRSLSRQFAQSALLPARKMFEHAIELDPTYAAAYAGLAFAEIMHALHYPHSAIRKEIALANAEKAIALSPHIADGYIARGLFYSHGSDAEAAVRDLARALSLNPDSSEANTVLGTHYMGVIGDYENGYMYLKKAYSLDQGVWNAMMLMTCLNGLDYPEETERVGRNVLDNMRKRVASNPHDSGATFMIASAHADLGEFEEARHWAEISATFATDDSRLIYNLACLHSRLGLIDESLGLPRQCIELGMSKVKYNFMRKNDPDLINVRKDPRFGDLLSVYRRTFIKTSKAS